jgi:NRPS condensation-like uncharacterized protein
MRASLPLTAFEEYMLCDDRPAYPKTGVFRFRFSGRLNGPAFEAALNTAVQRHPLMRATVRRRPGRRSRWIDNPNWRPAVQRQAALNAYGYPPAAYIDLTKEPGTRIWVLRGNGATDVVAQIHHSCTDALGMCQVIEDLLVGYASNISGGPAGALLRELDTTRLKRRGAPARSLWQLLCMARKQVIRLLGARQFLFRSPAPLMSIPAKLHATSLPEDFPAPRTHEFAKKDTANIFAAARRLDVTVNDLLARDLFLAVGQWRQRNGFGNDNDWLRFSVPVNLRTKADERLSMANCMGMVFLDRHPCDLADPRQLLASIHEEMQSNKRWQLGLTFVLSADLVRRFPGALSRVARTGKYTATCVFSNLGVVLGKTQLPRRDGRIVAGNVVLEGVDFVMPLRPGTSVAVCVYTYADRLCVMMHHDPRVLSDDQSRCLLEIYLRQIRTSTETISRDLPCLAECLASQSVWPIETAK